MDNLSADPRKHNNELNLALNRCISPILSFLLYGITAILSFVLYCFRMTTAGNLIAQRPLQHHHEQDEHLRNLSELPSREESTAGILMARTSEHPHEQQDEHSTNMSELPKKCIKLILASTTPRDVCRLAAVSTLFRSAANSNAVWNNFIPPQCYQILPTAVSFGLITSKKELYFRLCDSILIDGGRKIFWLERSTAKIGYMLSARAIDIIWSNQQNYWRYVSRDDSRFNELAELLGICWLEVRGQMDCRFLSADTEYRVLFLLKLRENSSGWNGQTMHFLVTTPEGEEINSEQPLLEREGVANDGWMEVVAGEFTLRAEDVQAHSSFMSFRMRDLTGWWKRGLFIDGVKIEPKSI